jgi:hypothetical protein
LSCHLVQQVLNEGDFFEGNYQCNNKIHQDMDARLQIPAEFRPEFSNSVPIR